MSLKTFIINSSSAQYTDEELQKLQSQIFSAGIFGDPDTGALGLQVTERGTPDMNVEIAAGKALVEVTISGRTFKVIVENTAVETVAIAANSSGSNRVDAIILRVDKDTEPNSLKTNVATIERVAGTGVSALTDGAIDTAVGGDGWTRLANIVVPNSTPDIRNEDIADTRVKVQTTSAVKVEDPANPAISLDDVTAALTLEEQTGSASSVGLGETDAASNTVKLAQSFKASKSKIRGADLYKKADTGTFTGTVTVALQADANGNPSGSNLASVTLTNAQWGYITANSAFRVVFDTEYSGLIIDNTYWIVVQTSTSDSANHPNLGAAGGNPYADGQLKTNNTTDGWSTVVNTDLYFKIIEGINSQIVKTSSEGIIVSDVLPVGVLYAGFTAGVSTSVDTNWIDYMDVTLVDVFNLNTGIKVKAHISATVGNQADEYTQYRLLINGSQIAAINLGDNPLSDADINLQGIVEFIVLNNNSLSVQKYISEVYAFVDAITATSFGAGGGVLRNFGRGTGALNTANRVRVQLQGRVTQPDANLNHQCLSVLLEKIG